MYLMGPNDFLKYLHAVFGDGCLHPFSTFSVPEK